MLIWTFLQHTVSTTWPLLEASFKIEHYRMWTSPSTNGAFEHCRKSTKVLISTPSNGEPVRLDWSPQLLKLLPSYATDFSTSFQLQQYKTRVQKRGLAVLSVFVGLFMTGIFWFEPCFSPFYSFFALTNFRFSECNATYPSILCFNLRCVHPSGACICLTACLQPI